MPCDYSLILEDKLHEIREANKDYDALNIYNFDMIKLESFASSISLQQVQRLRIRDKPYWDPMNPSKGNIILDNESSHPEQSLIEAAENTNKLRNMYESYCGQEEYFQLFIKNIEYSVERKNKNEKIIPKTFGKDMLQFDRPSEDNILTVNFKIYFVDNLPYWNNFLKHNPEIKPFEIKVMIEKEQFRIQNIETNFGEYTDIKDIKYLKYQKWLSEDSIYASSLKNFVKVLIKFIE